MLGHKISFNKFKKNEIHIKHFFLTIMLWNKSTTRKKCKKTHKYVESKTIRYQTMDHWKKSNKITKTNQNIKYSNPKSMGYSKSSYKREVYSDTPLP